MQPYAHTSILVRSSKSELDKIVDFRRWLVRLQAKLELVYFRPDPLILSLLLLMLLPHKL